ncbi:hypothetical protein QBZ16_002611 [Prototheca wickerhamii]|uniref:Transcription initiation factor TFIID subunit 1 n=1 Tax=Prototheca wickerhamii TaxID=3111 RepID=A0AAD9II68_PROWI|nr:hypothetical protein QBZ16_002611 [Prototheca wickerhamii]
MDDGNDEPMLGFLFGNVDQDNRVEADYLDEDAREQLAGLARLQGDLGLKSSLEEAEPDVGADLAPRSQAEDGVAGPAGDAEDFGDEEELIAEEEGTAERAAGAAAAYDDEEDYDMDDGEGGAEDGPGASTPAAPSPPEPAQEASAGKAQEPGSEEAAPRSPEPGEERPAPASSEGLGRQTFLESLPALAVGSNGVPMLRFSELFGPTVEFADRNVFGPVADRNAEPRRALAVAGETAAEPEPDEAPVLWSVALEDEADQRAADEEGARATPGSSKLVDGSRGPEPGQAPAAAEARAATGAAEASRAGAPEAVRGLFAPVDQWEWEKQVIWEGAGTSDEEEEDVKVQEDDKGALAVTDTGARHPAALSASSPRAFARSLRRLPGWDAAPEGAADLWRYSAGSSDAESDELEELVALRGAPLLRLERGWSPVPGRAVRNRVGLAAWEHRVDFEGTGEACAPRELCLDLNDESSVFVLTVPAKAAPAALRLEAAAAHVLPPPPAAGPSPGAAAPLARLNLSLDSLYGQAMRRRAGGTVGKPGAHARPAADLLTIPVKLSALEKERFHRPRAVWWPLQSKKARLQLRPGTAEATVAAVTLTALPGFTKSYLNVDLTSTTLSQLWQDLQSNGYEEARDQGLTPLVLVPGRPPAALALDVPLLRSGIKAGESKLNLSLAFERVALRPEALAAAIPDEINSALLRPPMAFSKKRALGAADGHVLLFEYMELQPLLLNRPGMGARLQLYYRRRNADDDAHLGFEEGAEPRWKRGSVLALGDDDESPFLGDLAPGARQLAVEAGLFRAPAQPYDAAPSDFLLVREPTGVMRLRLLTGTVAIGQQLPAHRIPPPNSRDVKDLEERRLYVYVFKRLKRLQAAAERRGSGARASISLRHLAETFPSRPESMIRLYLREACGLVAARGERRDDELYELREGARFPSEPELRRRLSPEEAVTLEASVVADYRFKSGGILLSERFGSVAVEKLRMAAAMLPPEPKTLRAARFVETAMQTAPWLLTDAAVASLREGRGHLQLTGAGDPTGRGLGYSFIRDVRHKAISDDVAKSVARKQAGKVQGTDADLRRMTTDAAKRRLLDYGLTEAEIEPLGRWVRIDLVRQFANAAAADGVGAGSNMKFVRHQKTTLLEQQKRQRDKAQRIFDRQVAFLHDEAEENLGNQADLEAELEREMRGEAARGEGGGQEDELRELEDMRREGLLGDAAGGDAEASQSTQPPAASNLVPGKSRRIRREVLVRGENGAWTPVHEVIYAGRDAPYALASLYQKEGSAVGPWGFGKRVVSGRPRGLPKLSYSAARGRGMGRGRGRGRGGGDRRPPTPPPAAQRRAKPRARAPKLEDGEDAVDALEPADRAADAAAPSPPPSGTPPASQRAAPRQEILSSEEELLSSASSEGPDEAEQSLSSDYVPEDEYLAEPPSPARTVSAAPRPAASGATASHAAGGTVVSSASAPVLDALSPEDLGLSEGEEDVDFQPEPDQGSDGAARGRRARGYQEEFDDLSTEDEAPAASRRGARAAPAPAPAKRARRASAVEGVAAAVAFIGGEEKPKGKHPVNKIIATIVTRLKRKKLWRIYFGGPVTSAAAPDYSLWVRPQDEMFLDKIQKKASSGKYHSIDAFRTDMNAILRNAIQYNSIGHGKHGGPDVISYAEGLVSDAEVEIDALRGDIAAAQAAWEAPAPDTDPYFDPGVQAAPAAPAPPVQQQQWVQCTSCQKWRVVSPTVYQATVAQGSEDAPWYCDMNFDRYEAGFGYYNDYPGRQEPEDDGEDVSGEGEDSDEEAAALARIRDRSTSRRGNEKRAFGGDRDHDAQAAVTAKRQKNAEPVVEADNWVACDRCNKWRLLRKDVFDRTVREDEQWFCEYNYGRPGASCADMDDEKAQALGAQPQRPAAHTLQAAAPLNRPGAAASAAGLAQHINPAPWQRGRRPPAAGAGAYPGGQPAYQAAYGAGGRPQLSSLLQNQAALAAALQSQAAAGRPAQAPAQFASQASPAQFGALASAPASAAAALGVLPAPAPLRPIAVAPAQGLNGGFGAAKDASVLSPRPQAAPAALSPAARAPEPAPAAASPAFASEPSLRVPEPASAAPEAASPNAAERASPASQAPSEPGPAAAPSDAGSSGGEAGSA